MAYEIFTADQTDSLGSSRLPDMEFWGGLAKFGGAANGHHRDGDFKEATPIEAPRFEYPFQEQGDRSTVLLRQKVCQGIEYIKALPAYSTHPEKSNAYLIGEGAVDDRGGVGVWERVFCTVPLTRVEYEKFPYPYQYIASTTSLGTLVRSVVSQLKYEYFLARDRSAFKPLQKLAMDVLPTGSNSALFYKSGSGDLHLASPTTFFVSNDPLIVAEDSEIKTWKHPIMYRVTRYVPGPTLAFLGENHLHHFPGKLK